ncbi:MAG: hypothetical protein UV20_C0017G0012 [Candidatus Magasanikbacteria bacterium GW2011_GWA2_42_32]|uniref:Uncharacterized protein n=1 Tax=Candidatus Magasanikbacteria bacterium GW2011_GWA2_42_32 TaxID=1619039 RepID=A0A0G1D2A0_9BACT|nr:MAG: hypothetical protein UV20_C0017G0012 [Candidatus Magasanikbacteria bacterium GW2011_GWA2_42_32]
MPKEIKKNQIEVPTGDKLFNLWGEAMKDIDQRLEQLIRKKRKEKRRQKTSEDEKASQE